MEIFVAGAIGSLITLFVAFIARLSGIPGEIRTHDRRVRERDEDLASWVGDRDVWLRRELRAERNLLAADNLLNSGEYVLQIGLLKERALHEWRDQERQARVDVAAIYDLEAILHRVWRRASGLARLNLVTPAKAEPVLNVWRTPPATPGDRQRGQTTGSIDDPTSRTLDRVVADAPARVTEYQ